MTGFNLETQCLLFVLFLFAHHLLWWSLSGQSGPFGIGRVHARHSDALFILHYTLKCLAPNEIRIAVELYISGSRLSGSGENGEQRNSSRCSWQALGKYF